MTGPPFKQDRPEWVESSIGALVQAGADIERARARIAELALELHAQHVTTADLAGASHDLEHVEEHLTRTRRGLLMSWPDALAPTAAARTVATVTGLLAIAPHRLLATYRRRLAERFVAPRGRRKG